MQLWTWNHGDDCPYLGLQGPQLETRSSRLWPGTSHRAPRRISSRRPCPAPALQQVRRLPVRQPARVQPLGRNMPSSQLRLLCADVHRPATSEVVDVHPTNGLHVPASSSRSRSREPDDRFVARVGCITVSGLQAGRSPSGRTAAADGTMGRRAGQSALAPSNSRITASRLNEAGFCRGGNLTKFSISCATTPCIR